jgi:outer membrane receptor protein involved in Fe transport
MTGFTPPEAWPGTTGKVAGTVTGPDGSPVLAATVRILGQPLGAVTDEEGKYTILNVAPGSYVVSVTRMGFEPVRIQEVSVSADQTTRVDVSVGETDIEMDEVVVTASRSPVDLNRTSSQSNLSTEEIEALPVQELEDIVNLQAGVVDGHFRGGRSGEVQYQVDGVSVNNVFDNTSSLKIDRSLLKEVQVISGTFDAEYGQSMSGVVNAVLKEGTPSFLWGAEVFAGAHVFPGNEGRLADDEISPGAIQNYQLNLSGPLPVPETVALVSGRRYVFDDYIFGERRFVPTDRSDFEGQEYHPTGDGERAPLGYSREWSGVAKLTNHSLPNAKLNYQALLNVIEGRHSNFDFRFNPDGLTTQKTFSVSHGLDWTHTLSEKSFLDLSLRQNYERYTDYAFEDPFDARYDSAGPAQGDANYELGAIVEGVQFGRFKRITNELLVKSSLTNQVTPEHLVKVGAELRLPKVSFGPPGILEPSFDDSLNTDIVKRHFDDPPDWIGMRTYYPVLGTVFAQDQIELPAFTVRLGLRLDYFSARTELPSDLQNPANSIQGVPQSTLVGTKPTATVSPRLGVAYPIEEVAAIHFAYGHFRQFPAIGTAFQNADYSVLHDLQAEQEQIPVMGNPGVKPEKTIQYEFGYKHALSQDLGVDVTVFYKDIRDLLGVEFITTYNNAEYARFTNVDFGNVLGMTLALDHRRLGPVSLALDYTWQQALGNSSDPRETATRAEANEDPRPRIVPFNWDQRHTLNMTASIVRPGRYAASAVFRLGSGQPYTPIIRPDFNGDLAANSGRKPVGAVLDLRAERSLVGGGLGLKVFGRVFNTLDTRFFNGFVFDSTGDPYESRFPKDDERALLDPGRFYSPRRIEIGLSVGPGGK